ncbi:DUF695 domain-containing protein [Flavobacterium sp.]|uniref:DUF695 domain-containing protein n=1 Tax=Flavobacterium sp. TaxID=239 RepID=UPI00262D5E68|nr:DUF695 domain-containing protein [Flavobacterium sp.]
MNFLKNIFGKENTKINSNNDFWNWFLQNEKTFFNVVKNNNNIHKNFFDKISPKLADLREGYFFVSGMFNDETAELVLTADGNVKNINFVEELVNAAPKIEGWKITAHKEPMDIENIEIKMGNYIFNSENIFFYSNDFKEYPDEIDISVIHNELNDINKEQVGNGTYIFLDNYLGEIDFINNIDNLSIIGKQESQKELIPISKLKDFLNWRRKEFIEKYEGVRYNTEDDEYSIMEAELESGNKLLAVINTTLLNWDRKASHPWICILTMKFDGKDTNGMPNDNDYKLLNEIEEEILQNLIDKDGYLYIGRQTANSERDIYFSCNDFRKPSKVFDEIQRKYHNNFEIDFEIFKDKYWQAYERFT